MFITKKKKKKHMQDIIKENFYQSISFLSASHRFGTVFNQKVLMFFFLIFSNKTYVVGTY